MKVRVQYGGILETNELYIQQHNVSFFFLAILLNYFCLLVIKDRLHGKSFNS